MRTAFPLTLVAFLTLLFPAFAADGTDRPGSADHPLVGRYAGSWIGGYAPPQFEEYPLPNAPQKKAGEGVLRLEGKVTKIAYHVPAEVSPLELYRNFRGQLAEAGFEDLFECTGRDECGPELVRTLPLLPLPAMWHSTDSHYFAAKKSRPEGDVYATLFCEKLGGSGKNACQVSVIEIQPMDYKMVDASKMAASIAERGSVALYGLYFDTDKATIQDESRPTLEEIAKLLEAEKELKVVIVGHTDNQGSLPYNMDLSKRRAEAVRTALVAEFGIDAGRMEAWGAGYLAPVGSNRSEEGRAKNRRVELVER